MRKVSVVTDNDLRKLIEDRYSIPDLIPYIEGMYMPDFLDSVWSELMESREELIEDLGELL